ncbi:hypothetical protein C1H46_012300 [Malus baccata]|uniref:Uncharacterized protein n=1 Tax=Malus baccata TaxID=106549 RepID=A0A540MTJ4_MALBA|nr:hypothetical protein C1H46_012300 [Malus baccata]
MDARENSRSSILPSFPSSRDKRIPIYVMMPANAFCIDGTGRPRIRKMGDLKLAARKEGKPQWEEKEPQKAGCYNSLASQVPFFGEGEESFVSDYGCFCLV